MLQNWHLLTPTSTGTGRFLYSFYMIYLFFRYYLLHLVLNGLHVVLIGSSIIFPCGERHCMGVWIVFVIRLLVVIVYVVLFDTKLPFVTALKYFLDNLFVFFLICTVEKSYFLLQLLFVATENFSARKMSSGLYP